jgi:hypothetical protein
MHRSGPPPFKEVEMFWKEASKVHFFTCFFSVSCLFMIVRRFFPDLDAVVRLIPPNGTVWLLDHLRGVTEPETYMTALWKIEGMF